MALITLSSARGAPGTTTSALALTMQWPRPVLLIEADVTGSSSILAGYFQGEYRQDRGLVDLAGAHRQGRLLEGLRAASMSLPTAHARFVPGLNSPAQADTLAQLWGPIAAVLRGLENTGTDVIVDAGRFGASGGPDALVRAADISLMVTGTTLPEIAAARARAGTLREELTTQGTGEDALHLLLVGEGRPYNHREAATLVNLPVAGVLAWDPKSAQVLSHGQQPKDRGKWKSSRFIRSVQATTGALESLIRSRRERLGPMRQPEHYVGGGHV